MLDLNTYIHRAGKHLSSIMGGEQSHKCKNEEAEPRVDDFKYWIKMSLFYVRVPHECIVSKYPINT